MNFELSIYREGGPGHYSPGGGGGRYSPVNNVRGDIIHSDTRRCSGARSCAAGCGSILDSPDFQKIMAEFPVRDLSKFYGPSPDYRLPVEQGAFSTDGKGAYLPDRSQLRYYSHPSRLNLDLKVGYDDYVSKLMANVPDGLQPVLMWIKSNQESFIEDTTGEVPSSDSLLGVGECSKKER